MTCSFLLLRVEDSALKLLTAKERNCLYLGSFKIQIFEIRSENLPVFVPLRDDIQILPFLSIEVIIGFHVFSLFLTIPAKKS
jgi:hypothetical protein